MDHVHHVLRHFQETIPKPKLHVVEYTWTIIIVMSSRGQNWTPQTPPRCCTQESIFCERLDHDLQVPRWIRQIRPIRRVGGEQRFFCFLPVESKAVRCSSPLKHEGVNLPVYPCKSIGVLVLLMIMPAEELF